MIELRRDCIWLAQPGGEAIPCSVEELTFEVVGGGAVEVEPEVLRHAAAGVLHYFKSELGRVRITLGEFAEALGKVLAGLGYSVEITGGAGDRVGGEIRQESVIQTTDLRAVACAAGKMGELEFFPRLRTMLREQLAVAPKAVEFHGLRPAVKLLLGRKHWTRDCGELEQRILETLRSWWSHESGTRDTRLVVR